MEYTLTKEEDGSYKIPKGQSLQVGHRLKALAVMLWGGGKEVHKAISHTVNGYEVPVFIDVTDHIPVYNELEQPEKKRKLTFAYLDLTMCEEYKLLPDEITELDNSVRTFVVGPERFLFLSDYATIYEQLDAANRRNTPSVKPHGLVSGQPGIGKSFSLMYFLIRRLEEAQPTLFVLGGAVYQFSEDGVKIHDLANLTSAFAPFHDDKYWILVDETPPKIIQTGCALIVIAASPDIVATAKLKKLPGLKTWYMDIWTWAELCAARYLGLKAKRAQAPVPVTHAPATTYAEFLPGTGFESDEESTRPNAAVQKIQATAVEDVILWLMWCAYSRIGGSSRIILEKLGFSDVEDVKDVMERISMTEHDIKKAVNKTATELPAQSATHYSNEGSSHDVIVTRPGTTSYNTSVFSTLCMEKARRPACNTCISGIGTEWVLELLYDAARDLNKQRANEILETLNSQDPDARGFLGRKFENLLLDRLQSGMAPRTMRYIDGWNEEFEGTDNDEEYEENEDEGEDTPAIATFPAFKADHREFATLKELSAITRITKTAKVDPAISNVLLKPTNKTFAAIDGLVLTTDGAIVHTYLIQSTVSLKHAVKLAPTGLEKVIEALPANAKKWDSGCTLHLVFSTTSANYPKFKKQHLTKNGANLAADFRSDKSLPKWLSILRQTVIGYSFNELLQLTADNTVDDQIFKDVASTLSATQQPRKAPPKAKTAPAATKGSKRKAKGHSGAPAPKRPASLLIPNVPAVAVTKAYLNSPANAISSATSSGSSTRRASTRLAKSSAGNSRRQSSPSALAK